MKPFSEIAQEARQRPGAEQRIAALKGEIEATLDDLADAPVDTSQDHDVPAEFLAPGRDDETVQDELSDPAVQAILRDAGLAD